MVKLEIIAAILSFALIFICGFIGQATVRSAADQKTAATVTRNLILAFFIIFAFASIGLLVHVFIVLQVRIGNGGLSIVKFLASYELGVTLGLWGVLALGTVIALPYMLEDLGGGQSAVPKSEGTLVADIGMTFDEVRARSTIKVEEPSMRHDGSRRTLQQAVFDYRIGDSAVIFPQSRYYELATGKDNDPHITELGIGITPQKMSETDLEMFRHGLQEKLLADGWTPGHFLARSEETVRLWGGARTAGDGRYWAKGNTLLIFTTKRVDEQKPDDPAGSAKFILEIDLLPRNHEPDLVFEPSAWKK